MKRIINKVLGFLMNPKGYPLVDAWEDKESEAPFISTVDIGPASKGLITPTPKKDNG